MKNDSIGSILIIGIGNPDCGDDEVGNLTTEYLRARVPTYVQTVQHSGEGTGLIDLWTKNGASVVYVVDATCSGLPPGSILYFEAQNGPLPTFFHKNMSTHAFGLVEAIELARSLDCLPQKLIIYGIEGQRFDFGAPLSSEVERASLRVMELILNELAGLTEMDTRILPWRS